MTDKDCEFSEEDVVAALKIYKIGSEYGVCACELHDLITSNGIDALSLAGLCVFLRNLTEDVITLKIRASLREFFDEDVPDITREILEGSDKFWQEVKDGHTGDKGCGS